MIVFGALIINLIITFIFYKRNPKEYKWFEFVLSVSITIALIFGAKFLVEKSAVTYTEYYGETIVSVYEEEPYNYWQVETCTRSYPCGTDSKGNTQYCTETYDCSHQVDVGPEWYCLTDLGNTYSMSEKYHDELVILYGTQKTQISKRKNHDYSDICVSSSGTKFQGKRVGKYSYVYKTNWNKSENTRKGVFTKHKYENRIKSSDLTLFNISIITDDEADSLGLYKYPSKIDIYNCPVFIGYDASIEMHDKYRRLNAKFGPSNQFRLWILVYKNKPQSIAHLQENYWVKGNKNELILCIGMNDNNEIQWSHAFSWATSNILTSEIKSKILDLYEYTIHTKNGQTLPFVLPLNNQLKKDISKLTKIDTNYLPPILPLKELGITNNDISDIIKSDNPILNNNTLNTLYEYLDNNLDRFERREFEEFSYIKVEPKPRHIITIYIIAFIVSILLNIWFSRNEINDY